MKRPPEVLRGAVTASRERLWAIGSQSERTLMLGTILLASVISAATAYALSQWSRGRRLFHSFGSPWGLLA